MHTRQSILRKPRQEAVEAITQMPGTSSVPNTIPMENLLGFCMTDGNQVFVYLFI
jgi:hypothetical protein